MSRRVVVTGMGAITPIGNSVEEFWQGVKAEKIGFAPITYFDTTDYKTKLAAEVKDFNPEDYMDKKAARRMEKFCQYAIAATKEAMEDSGLDMEREDPYMVGCSVGCGVGSLQVMEKEHTNLVDNALRAAKPAIPIGAIDPSVPPEIMTSASPYWIALNASPIELVPVAHAVTTFMFLPFNPNAILTLPAAIFVIISGTSIGLTLDGPFSTRLVCSFSIT